MGTTFGWEMRAAASLSESEEGVAEEAYDVRDRGAGFELHLDGVGEGDELSLAGEIQGEDGGLDPGDHAESLFVPAQGRSLPCW